MEIQDQRASRAAALSAARRRLARLKVAAVAGSVLAFAGLSAGMALKSTIKVVASSSSSVASLTVSATSGAPAAAAAAAAGATPSTTATATPVAASAATATTAAKAAVHIVSAQS